MTDAEQERIFRELDQIRDEAPCVLRAWLAEEDL